MSKEGLAPAIAPDVQKTSVEDRLDRISGFENLVAANAKALPQEDKGNQVESYCRAGDIADFGLYAERISIHRDVKKALPPSSFLKSSEYFEPFDDYIGGDVYLTKKERDDLYVFLGDASYHGEKAYPSARQAYYNFNIGGDVAEASSEFGDYLKDNSEAYELMVGVHAKISKTGVLEFVQSGCSNLFVLRGNGDVESFESGGLPLGIVIGARYDIEKVILKEGDFVIFKTDGMYEGENGCGEGVNVEAVPDILKKAYEKVRGDGGVEVLRDSILSVVEEIKRLDDDRTMLLFQYTG